MEAIPGIIIVSLTIGVICTFLLWLHDRKPYMESETYKTLSAISFKFNVTGSVLFFYVISWRLNYKREENSTFESSTFES